MNSDSKDKQNRLLKSFGYAFSGIKEAIKNERNLKIHLCISALVIVMGLFCSISTVEWMFVSLVIGGMLSLEMVNTAIERTVDLVTSEQHPIAKSAKDIAAGAVLLFAVISVIIGLVIFLPKLFILL